MGRGSVAPGAGGQKGREWGAIFGQDQGIAMAVALRLAPVEVAAPAIAQAHALAEQQYAEAGEAEAGEGQRHFERRRCRAVQGQGAMQQRTAGRRADEQQAKAAADLPPERPTAASQASQASQVPQVS